MCPTAMAIVFISTLVAVVGGLWLPLPVLEGLMIENGPVENVTVVFYGLAIAAVWLKRNASFESAAAAASTVVLVACVAREISLRRWLIDAPGETFCCSRATVGFLTVAIGLLLLVSAGWLAVRYRSVLWQAIRHRTPAAITLVALFFTLLLSQAMDKLPDVLERLGSSLDTRPHLMAIAIEEILEMMLPVLVIVAVWQARQSGRRP